MKKGGGQGLGVHYTGGASPASKNEKNGSPRREKTPKTRTAGRDAPRTVTGGGGKVRRGFRKSCVAMGKERRPKRLGGYVLRRLQGEGRKGSNRILRFIHYLGFSLRVRGRRIGGRGFRGRWVESSTVGGVDVNLNPRGRGGSWKNRGWGVVSVLTAVGKP